LTPEVQCQDFHRNHVIWQTKITKFWRNGNDSKQPYCKVTWNKEKFRPQSSNKNSKSICAVLTFDPQLKKILTFSVKDRYQLNYCICIKDFNAETNTSLKLNLFSFFLIGMSNTEKIWLPVVQYEKIMYGHMS
jgi:hypothetical protein